MLPQPGSEIHVRESQDVPNYKSDVETALKSLNGELKESLRFKFSYRSADRGIDTNLLVLFHENGGSIDDTFEGDSNRAQWLRQVLPQTATLAIQAPREISGLGHWWFLPLDRPDYVTEVKMYLEMMQSPEPPSLSELLPLLQRIIDTVTHASHRESDTVHLLGVGEGGSLAAQIAVEIGKRAKSALTNSDAATTGGFLGSVVTINGPLISYPTTDTHYPTPLFHFERTGASGPTSSDTSKAYKHFKRAFSDMYEQRLKGEGMPRFVSAKKMGSQEDVDEWSEIIKFWRGDQKSKDVSKYSGVLKSRHEGDWYPVIPG